MAQSGYTPILIYGSGTATNVPLAANLTSSANGAELALNYADGKLYYKNSAGTVTLLADKISVSVASANGFAGSVSQATATSTPAITLSTSVTGVLVGNGTAVAAAVSGTDFKTINSTSILGSGNISITSTPGGSNTQVQYNNAGAFAGSANLTFDGTNLTSGGTVTATKLIPTGNVTAGNGMYLPTTNTLAFSTNGSERMRIDSAGNVGIGITASSGITLQVQKTLTGSVNSYNIYSAPTNASDVTNIEVAYLSVPSTGFAVSNVYGYWASQGTFTGAVTNQMGFHAHSTLTGATNNYGFYSNIASGTGRYNFYANGTADNYFAGNVGIGLAPVANNGILQLGSYGSVKALMETATVSATAATGTINYDAATQAVVYYTSNASANWTVNFRGSASLSLNSMMQTGQSLTLAFLVTQGATAYYNSAVQVDGASVTPKWQGGTAPSSGNASSIDIYSYTIVKTGSAAFTVFASQTKFA